MKTGDTLDGRYTIAGRLGEGGMGEVYKATHDYLGATRVIKVVRPQISGSEDARSRFVREARAAIKVRHQNVATLHDFAALPDGAHYMVWEYIEGVNLAQRLRGNGTLPPREAIEIIVQALRGLDAIHKAGIVHRDISPENLMITPDGEVKIIDLGVAKIDDPDATSQTRTGIFVGKLRYASPEQLGFLPENEKIDGRTDIYAAAMVLFELLTGRPPYEAKSPHEYFLIHARDEHKKTIELPAVLPGGEALRAVLEKALARDRNDRYATAGEFAGALERVAQSLVDASTTETLIVRPPADELAARSTERELSFATVQTPVPVPAAPIPAPPSAAAIASADGVPQARTSRGVSLAAIVAVFVVLLIAAGSLLVWRQIRRRNAPAPVATTTVAPVAAAVVPSETAGTSLTVTSDTAISTDAVALETTATQPLVVPEREAPLTEKRAGRTREIEEPVVRAEPRPEPPPPPLYVDGGSDETANDRAIAQLRQKAGGARRIAIHAGPMQPELEAALKEELEDLKIVDDADVVVEFEGRLERLGRGRKLRAATATVFVKGRAIFRYQLPDEQYRVGMTPAEAFASVFANAIE